MALIAILMCVNFTSCSSDDDEIIKDDDGIITNQKKLVEVKMIDDSETSTWEYSYDTKGRLASAVHTEKYGNTTDRDIYNYTWGNNVIMEEKGLSTNTYTLENALIRTIKSLNDGDLSNASFTYSSSNQLLTVKDIGQYGTYIQNYTWENERMIKVAHSETDNSNDASIYEYKFSGKTCKGYFPLWGDEVDDMHPLFYAHTELVGMRSNQLPDQIYNKDDNSEMTIKYTYQLNKDEYIESCTMTYTEKRLDNNETYTNTYIFTFKWE